MIVQVIPHGIVMKGTYYHGLQQNTKIGTWEEITMHQILKTAKAIKDMVDTNGELRE